VLTRKSYKFGQKRVMSEKLLESFARLFVPETILSHFEIIDLIEEGNYIYIEMNEKSDAHHIPKSILKT
jgi:hypothetical protein